MTVEGLLVHLLQMLFDLSSLVPSGQQVGGVSDRTFDPVQLLAHLFQEMSSGSEGCRQALCKVGIVMCLSVYHIARKLGDLAD